MATWNDAFEATPSGGDNSGSGYSVITALKGAISERMTKEHEFGPDDGSGALGSNGAHKAGSGVGYIQEEAPTTTPDGTAFSSEDAGRVWAKKIQIGDGSNYRYEFFIYDGTSWVSVSSEFTGQISYFAKPPSSSYWVECDGSAITYTSYPALVYHLTSSAGGSAYVPDLDGVFIKVVDNGDDEAPGTLTALSGYTSEDGNVGAHNHDATTDEITLAHTHTIDKSDFDHTHTVRRLNAGLGTTYNGAEYASANSVETALETTEKSFTGTARSSSGLTDVTPVIVVEDNSDVDANYPDYVALLAYIHI